MPVPMDESDLRVPNSVINANTPDASTGVVRGVRRVSNEHREGGEPLRFTNQTFGRRTSAIEDAACCNIQQEISEGEEDCIDLLSFHSQSNLFNNSSFELDKLAELRDSQVLGSAVKGVLVQNGPSDHYRIF